MAGSDDVAASAFALLLSPGIFLAIAFDRAGSAAAWLLTALAVALAGALLGSIPVALIVAFVSAGVLSRGRKRVHGNGMVTQARVST